jgi:hypothetical protein
MPSHQLAEIFGFSYDNLSDRAERYRNLRLCPYNNKVPSCTKNSTKKPLGVCSVFEQDQRVITCPVRFREDWLVIEDAANFFFQPGMTFTSLGEVRLKDADGKTAGDIDFVLVSLDDRGHILDFGALEVQAVYISGNVSNSFEHYIANRKQDHDFTWTERIRPDFLSSSRKRLVPQLIYKGRILMEWRKKVAVAIQDSFYATLPELPAVSPQEADIAWFVYRLEYDATTRLCHLVQDKVIYTQFKPALDEITTPRAGDISQFLAALQDNLDEGKHVYPPVNLTLLDPSVEE